MKDSFDGPSGSGEIDAIESEFGFSYLDVRLYDQDECWVDILGETLPLENIPRDELFEIVAFLFTNAEYIYIKVVKTLLFELMLEASEGELTQTHPLILRALAVTDMVPAQWLRNTPLMVKIESLLDN